MKHQMTPNEYTCRLYIKNALRVLNEGFDRFQKEYEESRSIDTYVMRLIGKICEYIRYTRRCLMCNIKPITLYDWLFHHEWPEAMALEPSDSADFPEPFDDTAVDQEPLDILDMYERALREAYALLERLIAEFNEKITQRNTFDLNLAHSIRMVEAYIRYIELCRIEKKPVLSFGEWLNLSSTENEKNKEKKKTSSSAIGNVCCM